MYWKFSVAVRNYHSTWLKVLQMLELIADATRELKSKLLIVEDIPDSTTFNHVF
jgi:hypothetical protein